MRPVAEMTDDRGRVSYLTMQAEALHIDRKARLTGDDLSKMRRELRDCKMKLTVESQAGLLRYANDNLLRMERERQQYCDSEAFEVEIGGVLLVFVRPDPQAEERLGRHAV